MARAAVTAAAVAMALVRPAFGEVRVDHGDQVAADEELDVAQLVVHAPDRGRLERTELAIDRSLGQVATLAISLTSHALVAHRTTLDIEVPRGARVTAMQMLSQGVRSEARTLPSVTAAERFRAVTEVRVDPALLELVEGTRDFDRLRLHVFPVAKTQPARVQITIELPEIRTLELDAPGQLAITVDEQSITGRRVALPASPSWMDADPAQRPHVTALTSLFAIEPARAGSEIVLPRVWIGCGLTHERSLDKVAVRRPIKLAMPRLRSCYTRQLQGHWDLEGTAELHFMIDHDGRTRDVSITGTLANDDVRACLAEEVTTWKYSPIDTRMRISYPLTFRKFE